MLPESPRLRVSQAIALVNTVLQEIRLVVEGEVSGYSVSRGKFVFFELKDEEEEARISCFMMLHQLPFPLEDGMRVVVTGRPTVFMKSGKFSLTVQRIEAAGEGNLKRAFELLKKKLASEGLFDSDRKRVLPSYPRHITVISSRDAAGFGDFMRIAMERLPGVTFELLHVAVQGKDAEAEIVRALDYANSYLPSDAIALLRGGGSLEDLHAFNSELVARAIFRSKIPVVTGIGHERDETIADFCADVRAATPSNAAQILLPTADEVADRVLQLVAQGRRLTERALTMYQERCESIERQARERIRFIIESVGGRTKQSAQYITQRLLHVCEVLRQQVVRVEQAITLSSPTTILERGYSVTTTKSGKVVVRVADVQLGETLHTRVSDGKITSTVT